MPQQGLSIGHYWRLRRLADVRSAPAWVEDTPSWPTGGSTSSPSVACTILTSNQGTPGRASRLPNTCESHVSFHAALDTLPAGSSDTAEMAFDNALSPTRDPAKLWRVPHRLPRDKPSNGAAAGATRLLECARV